MNAPDIEPPVYSPKEPSNSVPQHSCDSHAHIFGPTERYPLSQTGSYTPHLCSQEQYAALLHKLGFQRAVLVQPSVYGTDNRLMIDALAAARTNNLDIDWRGVAVVDHEVTDQQLETFNSLGVRGVRLNLLYPGAQSHLEDARKLAGRIAPFGWHIQLMIDIERTPGWRDLVQSSPVDTVIDHMGHAAASQVVGAKSFADMLSLSETGRLWIKLTGPNRISNLKQPPFADVQRVAEKLVERCPQQLVFGTDWPHVALTTPMPDDGDLVDEFYRWIHGDEALAKLILVDNPARLYGFGAA